MLVSLIARGKKKDYNKSPKVRRLNGLATISLENDVLEKKIKYADFISKNTRGMTLFNRS